MQWDEANEVTVRVSWRVRLPSAFLTSDISAPCPPRSLRHSTLIPPLSLLRTTESIRPDSFGVNGQGPNSIGLIFA